ncbi:tryptophan-rich sensory protein [bacterium]|jgi:benzodiazapine receptor|nr:tryptophan-rich sensory protein [bacterium]
MRTTKLPVYAFFFMLTAFAAFFGSIFGVDTNMNWYQTLYKPAIVPPPVVFATVWPVLYVLIALAGARIYLSKGKNRNSALNLWGGQLVVNALFSPLFFGLKSPILGFLDTLVLFVLLALLLIKTFDLDRRSFYFLIPYFLWVGFAMTIAFLIMYYPFS